MGKLQVLPAQIANMIAAGEVVQRPASVIKELVENAVDAGADKIDVVLSDAGRTLIQVIDNGSGMSSSDAVLCFERHATSKIASANDLESILSYGFRGEALASIAAVSEVTLKTRRTQDDAATQVVMSDGKARTSSVSAPVGSNFAVRNLFYNTPARRKFLKSDNVELRHIVDEFVHVAIPHPEIAFTLNHNGKDLYILKKAKSLKHRVMDVFGLGVTDKLMDLEGETAEMKVSGFVGTPESARKTLGNQLFFVQGRFFRSAYLHKAVMKAYEEMIPDGVTPVYMIFLDVDPSAIDVNISPTKSEIKFENDSIVFQIIYACIKETLGRNSMGATIDFDNDSSSQVPIISGGFEAYRASNPLEFNLSDPDYNPFDALSSSASSQQSQPSQTGLQSGYNYEQYPLSQSKISGAERLFDTAPAVNVVSLKKKYLVTPVENGLMLINIRRASERILYERFLKALSGSAHVTQTALFPVEVQVGVQQQLVIKENAQLLRQLGYDISLSGNDMIVVGGVPEGCSCEESKIAQMLDEVLNALSEPGDRLPELVNQKLAARFAAVGAASCSVPSDSVAARRFIDTLFACANSDFTPGGRKVVTILNINEIDKNF